MQQSDHKKRMENAKKNQTSEGQIAASAVPTPAPGNYDYLALVILGASVVILAFVASKRGRARLRL
jgi:hypothetical protein